MAGRRMSASLVDQQTGEIVELDAAAAERRAERIRLRLDAIADNYTAVMPLIREAIANRDDLALGYRSPGDYVRDRFGGALQRLGVDVRREVVRELTEAGLSTRAIAPVVGTSNYTVQKDRESGVSHLTPEREPTAEEVAAGHKLYGPDAYLARVRGDDPPTVTGTDGKQYQATHPPKPSSPPKPQRRPLPDSFFDAAYDLTKKVEAVHRLTEDDRFSANREKVAAKHRNDLLEASDLLQQVINRLHEG